MVAEGRPPTETVTSCHKNVELPAVSCTAYNFNDCIDVPVEEVSTNPCSIEKKKNNRDVAVAGIQNRFSREHLRTIMKEVLHFAIHKF